MSKLREKLSGNKVTSFTIVEQHPSGMYVKDSNGRIYSTTNLLTAEEKGIISSADGVNVVILKAEALADKPTTDGIWLFRTRESEKVSGW